MNGNGVNRFPGGSIVDTARLAREVAAPFGNTDFQAQWRWIMVEKYTAAALREIAGLDLHP